MFSKFIEVLLSDKEKKRQHTFSCSVACSGFGLWCPPSREAGTYVSEHGRLQPPSRLSPTWALKT